MGALVAMSATASACASNKSDSQPTETSQPAGNTAPDGSQTTTTMFGMGPGGEASEGDCPSRMPGEPLTAQEAVVKFNVERICPAYVTIELGTPVTWTNDGDTTATVKVTAYQAPAPGAPLPVVEEHVVDPGGQWVWSPEEAGMLGFRISTVDAFVGTIEVQIPGQGSTHTH